MSDDRIVVPQVGGERAMLEGFLDYHRQTLEWKCSGLTFEQLTDAASPPSRLTLLGLMRHMTEVEHSWFEWVLLRGGEPSFAYSTEEFHDADWLDLKSHSVDEVKQRFRDACDVSRRNVASMESLDSPAKMLRQRNNEPVELRWIMIHMIEEYARHNGHADFLRERIDGQTGD